MDAVIPGSKPDIKRTGKRKKTFRIIAVCLIAALIAGGVFIYIRAGRQGTKTVTAQRTAAVVRGRLVNSITGSAPVVSSSRSELSPKVTATLLQISCKEGDQVKAGDVLFVLDNTDALMDIENTKNSIAQMQLTIDSTNKSISGLTVKAPYSGQVTDISVKDGDSINKGGVLVTLTDVSKLKVTLPFSGPAAEAVQPGQTAVVYIPDMMISLEGNVTYKSSKPYMSTSGIASYDIEITVENPGSLAEGMLVTAEITAGGTAADSEESSTLSYAGKKIIRSDAGGTVTELGIRENEAVDAGDVLFKLENEDLLLTSSTNGIKMENLKSQLEIKQKQLDYYTIKAPFDGTITSMGNASEGDTVKQGEVLAVVSDMSRLEFSINIDELDISQITAGQQVAITAEALEETQTAPFTGKVSRVAMEGSSQNGVTTYPVTVSVDDNAAGKLKTGMNIDAEIHISDKQGVLMVPVEAVTKIGNRSYVYVNGTGDSTQSEDTEFPTTGRRNAWRNGGPDSSSDTRPDTGTNTRPGTGTNTRPDNGTNTRPGTVTNTRPDNGTNTRPDTGTSTQPDSGTNTRPDTGTNTRPDTDTNTRPDTGTKAPGNRSSGSQNTPGPRTGKSKEMSSDPYYDGYVMVEVETGISNGTYIEITSGLSEGQKVLLPKTNTASGTGTNRSSQQNRNGGMMGGGMPMGGMMGGGRGF